MLDRTFFADIANAATPPVTFGWDTSSDHPDMVLLDDLVTAGSVLPYDMKVQLLSYFIDDPWYTDTSDDEYIDEVTRENIAIFAAMEPVVRLDQLTQRWMPTA